MSIKDNEFSHLHCHFEYSILDGMGHIDEYLDRVKEVGQTSLAMTDHGNLFGIYSFMKSAQKEGIKPIPGIEAYIAPVNDEGAKVKSPIYYGKPGSIDFKNDVSSRGAYTHMTMWARNNAGLKNLFKLSSISYNQENFYSKPRMDFNMLAEHSDGIMIATGCPSSEISTRLRLGQEKEAYDRAQWLMEVYGKENVYVEIMDHNMDIDLERDLTPKLVKLAKKLNLKLLATNDCHYANKHDAPHHEEILCAQGNSRMSDKSFDEGGKRFAFNGTEYYIKSAADMLKLFPEDKFPGAVRNTLEVASKVENIEIEFDPHLLPTPSYPDNFESSIKYFEHLVQEGFKRRYGKPDSWYDALPEYKQQGFYSAAEIKREAKRRIKEEYDVLISSDFINYFLIVHEYINWTKENFSTKNNEGETIALPIGPGRGSVGGSVIAYVLDISDVEPIRFGCIFERFLTAGRGNTFLIEYEDGTTEEIIASETKETPEGRKFIHQLQPNDIVL